MDDHDENISLEYIDYCNAAPIMAPKDQPWEFSFRNVDGGSILQTIAFESRMVSIKFSPNCNLI